MAVILAEVSTNTSNTTEQILDRFLVSGQLALENPDETLTTFDSISEPANKDPLAILCETNKLLLKAQQEDADISRISVDLFGLLQLIGSEASSAQFLLADATQIRYWGMIFNHLGETTQLMEQMLNTDDE